MLAKHFYQAANFWVVFFVPESDADIVFYNEFMTYLGEKQRAAVAKLSEKTTLFLVPPSDFSEKVLKVPGKVSISGVILRFQQPSSSFGSHYRPLEALDSKFPSLPHNRGTDGLSFDEDRSYPKPTSPNLRSASSWAQSYMTSSSDPFPSASSPFPSLSKPIVGDLPFLEKASDSLNEGSKFDQLQRQNPRLSSNWSPHHTPSSNSSISFPSQAAPSLPFDGRTPQKYHLANPSLVQGTSSSQYAPGSSGFPSYGIKPQPSQLEPKPQVPSSLPTPPLQPEQLAQLATLLGQRQQLGKASISSVKEDHVQSNLPGPPLQEFKATQNLVLPNHASASDSLASQFSQVQQQASNVSAVPHASNAEVESGRSLHQGDQQLQNSTREETEADPQKRLQATLQLAAALLQQIQQQAKTSDQK